MLHLKFLPHLKFLFVCLFDGSEEQGLTHYKVSQGVKYQLQPEGARPPARVRVPEAVAVPVQ